MAHLATYRQYDTMSRVRQVKALLHYAFTIVDMFLHNNDARNLSKIQLHVDFG